jgi:hypothetical protein
MIAVFVCDQDCIKTLKVFAHDGEAARDLFCTQSGVDKHTRVAGNDQYRIAC